MTQAANHFSAEILQRYRKQLLSPEEFLRTQAHLANCSECRAQLCEAVGAQDAFSELKAGLTDEPLAELEHLPYEQLAAYLDGQLDEVEREITESHLAICPECEADARDLRRYMLSRAETAQEDASHAPVERKSVRRRFFSFDFSQGYGALFPAGAAALVLVLAGLLLIRLATHRPNHASDGLQARVEQVQENGGVRPAPQPSKTSSEIPSQIRSQIPSETPSTVTQSNETQPQEKSNASIQVTANRRPSFRVEREQPAGQQTGAAASALAFALKDGAGRLTFDSKGNLHGLESLSPAVQQAVRASLHTQRVNLPPGLENLAGNNQVLMGSSDSEESGVPFPLIGPVGRVVRSDRPVFRWRPAKGATAYTVAVVGTGFKVLARSEKLTATEWTPPISLPRGATYYWQVTALKDGAEIVSPASPAPPAKFKILDQSLADELASVEKSYPDSHLVRGVTYARAGLRAEAEQEFAALLKANPHSMLARRLLLSVRGR